jgi:flavin-dependent dehydrogenase
VLLVGDAAGYVDALTGEGLGIAFGGAELLVGCVAADRPADYERQWRRMSRQYRMLTAAVLQGQRLPSGAVTDRAGGSAAADRLHGSREPARRVARCSRQPKRRSS